MTDTPRTDAAVYMDGECESVEAHVARELERELVASDAKLAALAETLARAADDRSFLLTQFRDREPVTIFDANCAYCEWIVADLPGMPEAKALAREHAKTCAVHPMNAQRASKMTFDEWIEIKRAKRDQYLGGEVPFGTAAEVFGRAAWDAAIGSASYGSAGIE